MSPFFRRDRTASTPIGAAVEGDAAKFSWQADLRARLDAQLSRATEVTLTAAKSWVALDDPPPKDVHLAQALHNVGLWGSEHEPGTHIVHWSEEEGTVTLRAWDWDLTRPLDGGGYTPMTRARTIPWPGESDQAHRLSIWAESRGSEAVATPTPHPVQQPHALARSSDEFTSDLVENQDLASLQSPRVLARLRTKRTIQQLAAASCIAGCITYAVFVSVRNPSAWDPYTILLILVSYPLAYWLHQRKSRERQQRITLTVGETLTLSERVIGFLARILVALVVWLLAVAIAVGAGAPSGVMPLILAVLLLLAIWWHVHQSNRPADP